MTEHKKDSHHYHQKVVIPTVVHVLVADDPDHAPTLIEKKPFDPRLQAELFHDALKGLVANNKIIMGILTTHSNNQRQQIILTYKNLYHKDLISVIKHELNIVGHYEEAILALLHLPAEYDAHELHNALSGSKLLLDEDTLIEILCSRNNSELNAIRSTYMNLYRKDLETVIQNDTKGDFSHFVLAILSARREETTSVDEDRAIVDAQSLLTAEAQRWGNPESIFIDILASRSYKQLLITFQQFEKLTGHGIEKSIEEHVQGDFKLLMMSLVKYVKNKHKFFAECLHKALKGLRTNDAKLIRIIVGRCEKDLGTIKMEFAQMYSESLQTHVKNDTHGNFRQLLLALAGYENVE